MRDNAYTGAGLVIESRVGKSAVLASRDVGDSLFSWMNQASVSDPLMQEYSGGACTTCGSNPCITINEELENVGHVCSYVMVYGAANTTQDVVVNASGSITNVKGKDGKNSKTEEVKKTEVTGNTKKKDEATRTSETKKDDKSDDGTKKSKKDKKKKSGDDEKKEKDEKEVKMGDETGIVYRVFLNSRLTI